MSLLDEINSLIYAKVISQGSHLSLLVEAPILGKLKACRIQVVLENITYKGLGVSIDDDTALIIVDTQNCANHYNVNSTIILSDIHFIGTSLPLDCVIKRLREILNVDSLGSLSDRAARHALLYILEAHDLEIRHQRLEVLKELMRT
ncbi:hypothetical protein [Coleofasciculus sp.]|uniref:hypothetical protein n=1 Tax=Coleofasciculus sp. TaxID=3100458 RepID=UPI0039F7B9F1